MNEPAQTSRYARASGAAVHIAGTARQLERAVDEAGGRLVDEDLGGLGFGEQRAELVGAAV